MEPKQYDILLDIKKYTKTDNILLVKGDNRSNVFNITIKDESEPYDLTGLEVQVVFGKFDNTTVVQTKDKGVTVVNPTQGKVKCELLTNSFSAEGKTKCEVRILQGEAILTSASFEFWVRKPLFGDDTLISSNDFPYYEQLIQASKNESTRISNENTRITNENTRKSNESTRVTEEGKRVTRFNQMEKAYKDAMNFSANQATLEVVDARLGRKNLGELNREIMGQIEESKLATITTNDFVTKLPEAQDGIINIESVEGNTLQNLFGKQGTQEIIFDKNINSSFRLKQYLNVRLKANVEYTLIISIKSLNAPLKMMARSIDGEELYTQNTVTSNTGLLVKKISYPKDTSSFYLYLENVDFEQGKTCSYNNAMILEGDHTQNQPQYFEGIQHVDSLMLRSVGKNLFDKFSVKRVGNDPAAVFIIEGENIVVSSPTAGNWRRCVTNNIQLKGNTQYTISVDNIIRTGQVGYIDIYEVTSEKHVSTINGGNNGVFIRTITTPADGKIYLTFFCTGGTAEVTTATFVKLQIEEGDKRTDFEPYKVDTLDIIQFINTPETSLKRLPNKMNDSIDNNGNIVRRTHYLTDIKVDDIVYLDSMTDVYRINIKLPLNRSMSSFYGKDNFVHNLNLPYLASFNNDLEHWYCGESGTSLQLFILKTTIDSMAGATPKEKVVAYLKLKNFESYYELETPSIKTIPALPTLRCSQNGTLFMESKIPSYATLSYPTNLTSRVQTAENELDTISDSTYRLWLMVISLADKQLQMSVIKSLTTETNADLKNKINEILNVWR